MTGGANFTRLIYPYVSSGGSHLTGVMAGLKLDRLWLALRIYDAAPVFVCSMCVCASAKMCAFWTVYVCVSGEYIREEEEEEERRRRENLGKYIFLITVSEVNAAYLGVPTAAGRGGGGEERGSYLTGGGDRRRTERRLKRSLPTQESGLCVWSLFVVQKWKKKSSKGGRKRRQRGEEKGKKEKIKLLILLCAYNHLSQLAWRWDWD